MSNNNITDGTTEFRVIDKRLFSILDLLYPVGRIIISNDSTAPYSDIGFGKWEALPPGYGLVAVGTATETHGDTTKTFTFEAGKTYGEFEHQLTVGELAVVKPKLSYQVSKGSSGAYQEILQSQNAYNVYGNRHENPPIEPFGGDKPHNNIPPCVAVYMWKRVA